MVSKKKKAAVIPEDLLFEILSRLPAKSLLRFRCVSKSLRALIDSPDFVKQHLDQALKTRSDFDIVFYRLVDNVGVFSLDLYLPHDLNFAKGIQLDCPVKEICGPREEFSLVGSCNGILCLENTRKSKGFLFWNPCTGKYRKVEVEVGEPINLDFVDYSFGHNHLRDDYNLVKLSTYHSSTSGRYHEVEVYSLKTDSWKKIKTNSPDASLSFRYDSAFVNGAIHWLVSAPPSPLQPFGHADSEEDSDNEILSCNKERYGEGSRPESIYAFDLGTEAFRLVPSPPVPGTYIAIMSIGELEGRLCFLYHTWNKYKHGLRTLVWVMEEYGIQESWTPLFTVDSLGFWIRKPIAYSKCRRHLLGLFDHPFPLKWCHPDEIESPTDIAIEGMPDNAYSEGSFRGFLSACFCLRSLVQL